MFVLTWLRLRRAAGDSREGEMIGASAHGIRLLVLIPRMLFILRVEYQIVFRAVDAGEASALFRFGIRRLQIVHTPRLNGDEARAATAGATTRINPHALR